MPNRFEGAFCRLIRHRREELNLTQAEVATKLGVTADCITLVELGYRRLDLDRIPALADAVRLNRRQLSLDRCSGSHRDSSVKRPFSQLP